MTKNKQRSCPKVMPTGHNQRLQEPSIEGKNFHKARTTTRLESLQNDRKLSLFAQGKRGDIAITILVIGVFAISSFAILSFILSDNSYGNSFVGISIMQKINADIDEYNFYKNNKIKSEVINSEFKFIEEGGIKYLYKEKLRRGKLLFSVKYPVENLS